MMCTLFYLTSFPKCEAYYQDNRPFVYRYIFSEVSMNKFNQLKHHLDHCIRIMDKSSSLFVSNPEKILIVNENILFPALYLMSFFWNPVP